MWQQGSAAHHGDKCWWQKVLRQSEAALLCRAVLMMSLHQVKL